MTDELAPTVDELVPIETQLSVLPHLGQESTWLRRSEVSHLLSNHRPLTQDLADKWHVALATLENDKRIIVATWRKYAAKSIGEFQDQELAYAFDQRLLCADKLKTAKDGARWANLVLEWHKRISDLLGLNSPSKNINISVSYDEYARGQGVQRLELLQGLVVETVKLIAEINPPDEVVAPLLEILNNRQIDVTPSPALDDQTN